MMSEELSRTGAPESNGGPVDGAAYLVRINVAQRHGADSTSATRCPWAFCVHG
jgi:hypothetical protein